jgi:hypothetical protein
MLHRKNERPQAIQYRIDDGRAVVSGLTVEAVMALVLLAAAATHHGRAHRGRRHYRAGNQRLEYV